MQLYWWPKTRSLRALWMLEEVGEPYERVPVNLQQGGQKDPAFLAVNPMGKLPALADGEAKLAESAAICAYAADKFPEAGLAPAIGDPQRGRYLHWLFFAPACIEPAFAQKFAKFEMPETSAGWGSYDRVFAVLEQALTAGPWLLGENFSAADVMIGSDLWFGIEVFKIVEAKPAFRAYVDHCLARPALQRALAIDAAGV
ncbi:MAG: glutathione S-transferase family protein [Methylobacteriaceae bacterium]|nr:glutathione S-transferase family protein [Methylobacteriaceae bacterium]